jgi:pimeloyl-ACP methyl ester carboxylesterase
MCRTPRRKATLGVVVVAGLLAACSSAQDIGALPGPVTQRPPPSARPSTPPSSRSTSAPSTPPTATPPPQSHPGFGAGPPGQGLPRFYRQQVTWTPCDGSFTCASVWVPLDYAHPDGTAITIKAKMSPSANPGHPNGTLFINPGGPGASGIAYLRYVHLGAAVTSGFQVVGFDPRGVGQSTPVECVSDQALDAYVEADPSPDTPQELATLQRQWRHFTQGCVRNSGPLLAHVSTIEAARDMDILRAVVKDPVLNYYGASYGTYLGATYAALFPKRVGRMVLDGALDPEASSHALFLGQTAGFQMELTAYLTDCVSSGNCFLGETVPMAQQQIIDLLKQIDAHPLPSSSGREVTEGLAAYGVIYPLYFRQTWPIETQVLEQALEGNGSGLLAVADQYLDRGPDGHYTTNSIEVQSAVNCLDHPEHESLAQIEADRAEFVKASPVFGPIATWFSYACSNWPIKPALSTPDYAAPGAPPIVVVGTTRDPATPYQMAVNLANELDSGVLLTRNGDGHTAYASGNVCIEDAVDSYLSAGRVPPDGTTC